MSWISFLLRYTYVGILFMSWLHFMIEDMAIIEVYVIFRCDVLC